MSMKNTCIFLVLFNVALCVLSRSIRASQEQVSVGVRSIGLGEAFVGVADDGSSITWNPAGVSKLQRYSIGSMYSDLFHIGKTSYLNAVIPTSEKFALGIDWTRLSLSDPELNFSQNILNFSYSYNPIYLLAMGVNLKYFNESVALDGVEIGTTSGWGADAGLLVSPVDSISIGVVAQNAIGFKDGKLSSGTFVKHDSGKTEKIFPANYKFGIAYRPHRNWLISTGIDDRLHVGTEFALHPLLTVRTGIQKDLQTDESPTYSIGGTISYQWLNLNYAYLHPPTLKPTSFFSISLNFSYLKPPVKIEMVRINELYPVHRFYYAQPNYDAQNSHEDEFVPAIYSNADIERYYPLRANDTIGRIWLKNITDKTVTVKVKLYADKFVSKKGTEVIAQLEIEPNRRISATLRRIVFTDEVLELTEAKTVETKIEVSDITNEARRKATISSDLIIHSRNSVVLDDVAKLSSFISPTNRAVTKFVNGVLGQYTTLESAPIWNLYAAMIIFDALSGISYRPDANIARGSGEIDAVKFPAEMLRSLTAPYKAQPLPAEADSIGDCDDSTVLYCSLLEAAGIHTALIKSSGHVLMAFDLGKVSLESAEQLDLSDELYVPINGYVWIPIETTSISEGFVSAWQTGSKEISTNKIIDSITTQMAWGKYGSIDLNLNLPCRVPSKDKFDDQVRKDLNSEWTKRGVDINIHAESKKGR